jgi:hypothetical protein
MTRTLCPSLRSHPHPLSILAIAVIAELVLSACGTQSNPDTGSPADGGTADAGKTDNDPSDENACSSDADCASSTGGTACVLGGVMCGCQADADCRTSPLGLRCTAGLYACTCETAADCPAAKNQGCVARGDDGFKQCDACTDYFDCFRAAAGDACDKTSGTCKPCATDADCDHLLCDTASGRCNRCAQDGDCTASPYGSVCTSTGTCGKP